LTSAGWPGMGSLLARTGSFAGRRWKLERPFTVLGRGTAAEVPIPDPLASRSHAHIRNDDGLFTLVDGGSRNGTVVNGRRVHERLLDPGDRLRIGEIELVLETDPEDRPLSQRLPGYRLVDRVGEGGMGVVFAAEQLSLQRQVALKILSPKQATRQEAVRRFVDEARHAGRFHHPNLIQVHDVGSNDGVHYFSMEFVEGPTLNRLLKSIGTYSIPEVLEVLRQATQALGYLHGEGIVHRDLKPDNLMVHKDGTLKLADLGISRTDDQLAQEVAVGRPERVMGTPAYLAPEAILGERVDGRADAYALGATVFHLLIGRAPFSGPSADVLKSHVHDPIPALATLRSDIPQELVEVVHGLLAKDPAARTTVSKAGEIAERLLARKEWMRYRGADGRVPLLLRWNPEVSAAAPESAATPEAAWRAQVRSTGAAASSGHGIGDGFAERGRRWMMITLAVLVVGVGMLTLLQQLTPTGAAKSDQPSTVVSVSTPAKNETTTDQSGVRAPLPDGAPQAPAAKSHSVSPASSVPAPTRVTSRPQVALPIQTRSAEIHQLLARGELGLAHKAITTLPAGPERSGLEQDLLMLRLSVENRVRRDLVRAVGARDVAAAKTVHDELPKWIDPALVAEVEAAIQALVGARDQSGVNLVQQMRRAIARWRPIEARRLMSDRGPSAAGSPSTPILSQLDEAAAIQMALPGVLAKALTARRAKGGDEPRFPGVLQGMDQPVLAAISEESIQLSGGANAQVELRWSALPVDDIRRISAFLSEELAKTWEPAFKEWDVSRRENPP
jgi:hypothetical protein